MRLVNAGAITFQKTLAASHKSLLSNLVSTIPRCSLQPQHGQLHKARGIVHAVAAKCM